MSNIALPLSRAMLLIPVLLGLPVNPFALLTTLVALLTPALLMTRRKPAAPERWKGRTGRR